MNSEISDNETVIKIEQGDCRRATLVKQNEVRHG